MKETKLSFVLIILFLFATIALAGCIDNPGPSIGGNSKKLDQLQAQVATLQEQLNATTQNGQFSSPPGGVQHFTLEVDSDGCAEDTPWLYSPGGSGEWFVNTGENNATMNYGNYNLAGDKGFETKGEWFPLGVSSDSFSFCFYAEDGETVTIAIALVPPEKG